MEFSFSSLILAVSHSVIKLASSSISFSQYTIMSSAILVVFGTNARILSSLSGNMSEAIVRPNGSISHPNLAYGVLNVVRRLLARSSVTCVTCLVTC